jgi:hypothetical protein
MLASLASKSGAQRRLPTTFHVEGDQVGAWRQHRTRPMLFKGTDRLCDEDRGVGLGSVLGVSSTQAFRHLLHSRLAVRRAFGFAMTPSKRPAFWETAITAFLCAG